MRKQVYSDGKSRNLDLGFEIPINNDVKISDVEGNAVPFILAKRNKIRFTKGIPTGDLFVDFEESLPVVRPVPLDNMGLALIKQKDIDRLNIFAQELGLKEAIINKKELDIQALGEAIKSLETDNAQRIDENLISANQAFQEVYAYINKVNDDANANLTYNTDFVLSKVNEVLLALQAHQEAKNPHKITKETVGLSLVDNTADIDKPVSKAVQEALNQKLDVAEADKIRGEIKKSEKKFEKLSSGIMNMTGGLAQLELPRGGKAGQALIKGSNKDGDFIWGSGAIPEHNETLYRDAANAHPISSITGLTSALDAKANIADLAVIATSGDYNDLINKPSIPTKTSDLNNDSGFITKDVNNLTNYTTTTDLSSLLANKQDTISDLNTIRSNAGAGKNASDTISTYGDVVTYNASDFATAAQGSLADTAVQPGDLATVATSGDYDDLVDKPTIPTKTSDLNNDSGFITKDVNNLTNYTTTTDLNSLLAGKQDNLVSGTSIKTINTASLLGSGDISLQTPLVSGTSIKTVNSNSLLGSGDIAVQETLVSGTNIKTINNTSLLGSGDITVSSLPSQTGQAGKFLTTDGTDASWATISGGANTDLSNVSATGKATAVSWGMPDYTAEVSLGQPTTYQTLPCDCYVYYTADSGADVASDGFYYANANESYEGVFRQALTYTRKGLGMFLPKGWKVKRYVATSTIYYVPLKGVNNA